MRSPPAARPGISRGVFVVALALAACRRADRSEYQGYVEGEYVHVAAALAGRLDAMSVARGDQTTVGAPLFALESAREAAAVEEAEAQIAATQATLADLRLGRRAPELDVTRAELDEARADERRSATRLARDEAQVAIGGIAQQQVDDARAQHDADLARVRALEGKLAVAELPSRDDQVHAQEAAVGAARAALEQARWSLDQKTVASPRAGAVVDTLYRQGEWVSAGNPIVRLLPPENVKVRFFVPETIVGGLTIGRSASVGCDGCGADIAVTITYVASEAEYTPPVIYSNETRAKLVFMVEARPALDSATRLRPGQPVSVTLR
jgi:HlyD family secretion protein